MKRPRPVEILGVHFHNLTRAEAASAIASLATADGKHAVVKPYSEFMPRAAGDGKLREILNSATLCLPDGVGIVWAAYYLSLSGGRLRALVQLPLSLATMLLDPSAMRRVIREPMAGVELTWKMIAELDRAGASVFLLGGAEEEVSLARQRIEARFPSLKIAGSRDGYFRAIGPENDRVVDQINGRQPDVLLVAMGFPRQERWIAANLERLDVRVAVAEGGSFSFIAGTISRAPPWMRRAGLEWLYRLGRQPWRLRRQLALPRFVWLVLRERLSRT
jgi:N-acetylglucosaminyldiphosphoundecaprenol N-acetyl-beta-D-mannosaminyltransferase